MRKFLPLAFLLIAGVSANAYATGLDGDTISLTLAATYDFGGGPYTVTYDSASTTVPGTANDDSYASVTATGSTLTLTGGQAGYASDSSVIVFNGFIVQDTTQDPGIVGVTIDANNTNYYAPVSFTSDSVSFDIGGNGGEFFTPGDQITVDLQFVPEPAYALPLCGSLLLLVLFARRTAKRQAA